MTQHEEYKQAQEKFDALDEVHELIPLLFNEKLFYLFDIDGKFITIVSAEKLMYGDHPHIETIYRDTDLECFELGESKENDKHIEYIVKQVVKNTPCLFGYKQMSENTWAIVMMSIPDCY